MDKNIKQLITVLLKNYQFENPENKKKISNLLIKMNKTVSSITNEELFKEISNILINEKDLSKAKDKNLEKNIFFNSLKRLIVLLISKIETAFNEKSDTLKEFESFKKAIERAVICRESSRLQALLSQIIKKIENLPPFMEEEKKEFSNILSSFENMSELLENSTEIAAEKITDISEKVEKTETIDDFKSIKSDLISELDGLNSKFNEMKDEIKKNNEELHTLKKKMAELQKASENDPLTGILNRKGFESQFIIEHERMKRYGSNIVLAIMDIDDFKSINDNYGHLIGDQVLKAFTSGVQRIIRKNDVFCRIGGDEFVLMLAECTRDETELFFNKLYAFFNSNIYNTGSIRLKIHISSGATNITLNDTIESVLERADKALYVSKNQGKNRLTIVQ